MLLKRVLIASAILFVLGLVGWCVVSDITARTMSAGVVLYRLAGVDQDYADDATLRQAMLKRVPVGTKAADIITFLESQGVERDRFVGGQFFRYQVQGKYGSVLALLSSPPWIISIFCGQASYGVRFLVDPEEKLEDIIIEHYTKCL